MNPYNGVVSRMVDQSIIKAFDDDLRACLDQLRTSVKAETDPAEREKGQAMIRRLERELGEETPPND